MQRKSVLLALVEKWGSAKGWILIPTNDQQAEKYGQAAGLLLFLGLDTGLDRKNRLGSWRCQGCWFGGCRWEMKGVIAIDICVI